MANNDGAPISVDVAGVDHDESALSPEQMLKLVDDQQSVMVRQQLSPIPWMLGVWGIAWLIGFGLLWAAAQSGSSWISVPLVPASVAFAVLIGGAIVISTILGIRISTGVQGNSTFAGTVYGLSWLVASTGFSTVGAGLIQNGLSPELASLYFPAVFGIMAGMIYFLGAALWQEKSQLVLGSILLVAGAISPFFGAPTNNVVMALVGGGSMLIAAIVFALHLRRMA
ncbi:hypothetical protein [Salinibacterium sp. SWN167]|uniref:hypothetical protein n=1 Tax=Salinibacterium sp. SWN167 TaxID=2792054 RepID=UPI0018CF8631|nr:hypothetical protein [Salinibacterium sp. SWN167]MBH0084070.1 hypothetical protein [Salinibacterium sp. SWN167]